MFLVPFAPARRQDLLDTIGNQDSSALEALLLAPPWLDPFAADHIADLTSRGLAADHPRVLQKGLLHDPPTYVADGLTWLLGLTDQDVIDAAVDDLNRAAAPLNVNYPEFMLDRSQPAIHDALGGHAQSVSYTAAEVANISTALQALAANAFKPQDLFDALKRHYSTAAANGWAMDIF